MPKISSCAIRMRLSTSAKRVGSTYHPFSSPAGRPPPATSRAPAATTAASTSSGCASGTCAMTSSVTGEITSILRSLDGATHLPPTNSFE